MKRFAERLFKGIIKAGTFAGICCMLGGCSQTNQASVKQSLQETTVQETEEQEEQNYRFLFRGEGDFQDGNTYHTVITGSLEDETFELLIEELPALALNGTYVFEEGKGYKLYFEDSDSQYVYSQYDTDTKEFSFKYNLNLGEALGVTRVEYVCKDEAFAETYDGIGLGKVPPVFTGHGYGGYAAKFDLDCKLTCFEDGTAVLNGEAVVPIETRKGTYTYDEENNVYHITLSEQAYTDARRTDDGKYQCVDGLENIIGVDNPSAETEFVTVYDPETDTYSLDMQIVWFIYANIEMSYTPD